MTRLEFTYTGTLDYIETPILQGRDVLEVYLDGIGRSQIVGSAPTGQEVAYDSSLGRITFPDPLEQLTQIVVLYQNL